MIFDKNFKHIQNGNVVSAYKYGKESYDEEWLELKEFGAIPECSSDYHSPNLTDEDYFNYGTLLLSNDEKYVEC